jgi:hypothetical protein
LKLPTLKRDARAALAKDRAALDAVELKLTELEQQRANKLLEADGYEAVWAVDRAIAEQRAAAGILRERMRVLAGEVRKAERARLEAARDAAIDREIVPQLAEVQKLATSLEQAVHNLATSYAALDAATRKLNAAWTPAVPRPRYWNGAFSLVDIAGRLSRAMEYGRHNPARFAEFARMERDEGLAEMVARQCAEALKELKAVEITLPRADEDEAVDVADLAPEPARGLLALATA